MWWNPIFGNIRFKWLYYRMLQNTPYNDSKIDDIIYKIFLTINLSTMNLDDYDMVIDILHMYCGLPGFYPGISSNIAGIFHFKHICLAIDSMNSMNSKIDPKAWKIVYMMSNMVSDKIDMTSQAIIRLTLHIFENEMNNKFNIFSVYEIEKNNCDPEIIFIYRLLQSKFTSNKDFCDVMKLQKKN